MEYLDVKTASEQWNIGKRRINTLIEENRIPGVVKFGNKWLIPKDAEKPESFTKGNRKNTYRYILPIYYLYINEDNENTLTSDELELYHAQLQLLKGNAESAYEMLQTIISKTENFYVKIGALFVMFYACVIRQRHEECLKIYDRLESIFADDFPHRRDFDYMMLELYRYTKGDMYILKNYHIDFNYEYGPNLYLLLSVLSSATELIKAMLPDRAECSLDYYEISCRAYECHGYDYVSVQMHIYMACTYYLYARHTDGDRHLKAAVEQSYRLGCVIFLADFYKYIEDRMDFFLNECDVSFSEAVHNTSALITTGIESFLKFIKKENLYAGFTRNDYKLLGLVINNFANKEIAGKLKVSEKTVERLLSRIYEKTGVRNKKELMGIFNIKSSVAF